ncbi:hypothetical protein Taro_016944, partial [Colocasia esculenta]|nr:hypothetical protein [Colocasia esculenta]
LSRRKARAQASGPAKRKAYVGTLKPLVCPESSLATSRDGDEPPIVYSWWRHFLLDCGYPSDVTLSAPIAPGSFASDLWREWERHIRHSIACVGPVEFISRVESGTRLLDFWGAVVEVGEVVKIPPEKVVLPPDFSPALGECFILLTERHKQNASYNRKRRASREAGPLQPTTRGRAPRPSPSTGAASQTPGSEDLVEVAPRDDVIPPVNDDYNPTFDGTPSPDATTLPQASPTEQGYVPTDIFAGEGREHPDATSFGVDWSSSLQAIHDLLISGPEMGLPGFSDFAFVTVSSTAVLPTASPLDEGEVPRGTDGESDDTVRLIQEMMESSPSATIPPSVADVAGAEITSHSAAIASPPPGTNDPLPGIFERPRNSICASHASWPFYAIACLTCLVSYGHVDHLMPRPGRVHIFRRLRARRRSSGRLEARWLLQGAARMFLCRRTCRLLAVIRSGQCPVEHYLRGPTPSRTTAFFGRVHPKVSIYRMLVGC